MRPGCALVTFGATSVFPWKRRRLGKQVGVAPGGGEGSRAESRGAARSGCWRCRGRFAPPSPSAPRSRAAASGRGGRGGRRAERRAPGPRGQPPAARGPPERGRSGAKPGRAGGGEPAGLIHMQDLEAGGDRESPKLMQVSWQSGMEASKLSVLQSPSCGDGWAPLPLRRSLGVRPTSRGPGARGSRVPPLGSVCFRFALGSRRRNGPRRAPRSPRDWPLRLRAGGKAPSERGARRPAPRALLREAPAMGSPGRRRGPLLSTRPRARKGPTSAALKTLSRLRDGASLRAAGRPLHGQARARRGPRGALTPGPQVPGPLPLDFQFYSQEPGMCESCFSSLGSFSFLSH